MRIHTYIQENKKFSIGDTVMVTYKDGHIVMGYVCSVGVFSDGDLFYPLMKFKENGEVSKDRLYHKDEEPVKMEKI